MGNPLQLLAIPAQEAWIKSTLPLSDRALLTPDNTFYHPPSPSNPFQAVGSGAYYLCHTFYRLVIGGSAALAFTALSTTQAVVETSLTLAGKVAKAASLPFYLFMKPCFPSPAILLKQKEALSSLSPKEVVSLLARYLPKDMGYATSLFQDSGVGTHSSQPSFEGRSNWDKWMTPDHVAMEKDENHFVNYLDHPEDLIKCLKETKATSFRLSLERCIIEPSPGEYDPVALKKYHDLIRLLKENGINVILTLHHFVDSDWFQEIGRFEKEENIPLFVQYCLDMVEEFKEDVTTWMTFNELLVYILQTYVRKVYPGKGHESIFQIGTVLRNLLLAHILVYRAVKEKHGERIQMGFSHQWIKFVPFSGNIIERAVCYFFASIVHKAVYHFFKRSALGHHLAFQVPGVCNVHLDVPLKKGERVTDFTGVQNYGEVPFKCGLNGGHRYPGEESKSVTNLMLPGINQGFTAGATCRKGGAVARFGPAYSPEALLDVLLEASEFKQPIVITEIGWDLYAHVDGEAGYAFNEELQRRAYETILTIVALARCDEERDQTLLLRHFFSLLDPSVITSELVDKVAQIARKHIDLRGVHFWTLLGKNKTEKYGHSLEWEEGWKRVSLGASRVTVENHRIKTFELNQAGQYLADVLLERTAAAAC